MRSAQETYKAMLRDHVAPALRELGLTGSGSTYRLPDDHYWAQVGFQGSRYDEPREVAFTVNLSVVARDVWARAHDAFPRALSARPAANVRPSLLCQADQGRYWADRLGVVTPAASDLWWHVRAGEDT
jgi:hypothetical protein